MSSHLRLHLLNEFRLIIDNRPVEGLHQPRLQALLAYLVLHADAPQPRRQIAVRFWLDSSEQQARTNLRKLIHRLLQQIPAIEQWLVFGQHEVAWRAGSCVTSDVTELTRALDQLEAATRDHAAPAPLDPAWVEAVMRAYSGDLLPTCYDEWLLARRDALHSRVCHALQGALPQLESSQAYAQGIRCADFLLRLDPLHEETHRHLMRLHALKGNRAAALQVYHACVQMLRDELDVPPSAETEALYARLQQADPLAAPARPSAPSSPLSRRDATAQSAAPALLPQPQPPLVGRQAEWQTLLAAWQAARRGPQLCLIWGEAGMGKTRLIEELQQWASLAGASIAAARAYAAEGNLPYAPVTAWLRSAAIRPAVGKLAAHWRTEIARLLPELQQDDPTLPPPQPMTESWQQQRFHEALACVLPQVPGPCLLILDDSQWCDVETLRWLRYLLHFDPSLPLLVAATVRSAAVSVAVSAEHPLHDLVHELQRSQQITQIDLEPLEPDAATALIRHLAGSAPLPDADHLAAEAEGNPLFIVEMVRARLAGEEMDDTGKQPDAPRRLPPTVQAVIASRLAHLSPAARHVAEAAAAIGRAFDPALIGAAAAVDEDQLVAGLDELWQRRILREAAGGYEFSHDKIREVAYAAIPPMQRRRLHRNIAQTLESRHAADPMPVWDQLAHHHAQAQQPQAALPYLVRLAQQAEALDAFADAVAYYARALALQAPYTDADPATTFDLYDRHAALLDRAGESAILAQDVAAMFDLAQRLHDPTRRAKAHLRQASYLSRQGDVTGAIQAGEQALALYRGQSDSAGEIQALRELGLIAWSTQAHAAALRFGREVLQLHRRHSDVTGEATALHNLAEIYRSLQSPQQAVALYEQALQLYWSSQDQRSQAVTLYGLAATYRQMAQPAQALHAYQRAETHCEQAHDRIIRSRIYHARAILHWELGDEGAAIDAMCQAVTLSKAAGYLPGVAYSCLAQGYMAARTGAHQEAINLLEDAAATLRRMDDAEGEREVQARLELLHQGRLDLPEPPASLHWLRSHVVLTDWKVYCEFELPHLTAHPDSP